MGLIPSGCRSRHQSLQMVDPSGATNPAVNDADDRGEPILLTNDNQRSSNSNSQNPVAIQSSQTESDPSSVRHDPEGPRPLPDFPKLPPLAQKLNETNGPPSKSEKMQIRSLSM